jgi:hypothetical protein
LEHFEILRISVAILEMAAKMIVILKYNDLILYNLMATAALEAAHIGTELDRRRSNVYTEM